VVWLWLLVLIVAIYWIVPELALHYLHLGLIASPRVAEDYIALTFDDGPGAATQEVLKVLERHGAKGTFFLVGSEAATHRDLAAGIARAGHEIASHGKVHRSAWLLGPWATMRQLRDGKRMVADASGQEPKLMRPPWGHMNLLLPFAANAQRETVALWSYDPGDWRPAQDPGKLADRIVAHLRPGQVYLLHDAGGDGRLHTAKALEIALPQIREKGYQAVTLSELLSHEERLSFGRRVLQAVWGVWELGFERINRIERIGDVRSVLRIGRVTYRGLPATLKDGRMVKEGDVVGELHFRNPQLAALGAIRSLPLFERAMRELAVLIQESPRYRDLEVFFGISVAFRGVRRFGFEVKELGFTPWRRFVTGTYLRWVMTVYHPQGLDRLHHRRDQLEPKGIFITRETILARYGVGAAPEHSGPGTEEE
jgi:peptidoglycan/xylan/chitin deacetylase (PgdA/CDA1 family)